MMEMMVVMSAVVIVMLEIMQLLVLMLIAILFMKSLQWQYSDAKTRRKDETVINQKLKTKMALASFYENDGEDETPAIEEPDNDAEELATKHTMTTRKAAAQQKKTSRFGTIASLNQSEDGSSDEEEGQAFYAGGSEHSGQQVLGPGKKKKDIVSEMFRSVQQHGAEIVDPEAASSTKRSSTFTGTGYRLGQTGNDSEVVRSGNSSLSDSHSEVILKLWKEGFSINDGPLRNYADPANQEFLEAVRRGEVPQELIREARGQEVHLNMEDHRHVEFVQSGKPKVKAFTGKGHILGSPSPAAVGVTVPLDDKDRVANEEEAKGAIAVDPESPATTVQIRLADGTRLLGRFNLSHTVADVRRYITIARPQYEHQSFCLLTTFPSKELEGSLTLDQAGLTNAAVLQRLI